MSFARRPLQRTLASASTKAVLKKPLDAVKTRPFKALAGTPEPTK